MARKNFGGKVIWLGHSAFLIQSPKLVRIALDPWIGNNPKFPRGFDWGKVDVVAASHGHFDHFGEDGIALLKKTARRSSAFSSSLCTAAQTGSRRFPG